MNAATDNATANYQILVRIGPMTTRIEKAADATLQDAINRVEILCMEYAKSGKRARISAYRAGTAEPVFESRTDA